MQLSAPVSASRSLPRNIALTLAAAALITLSAKTQVPFWPVPMTLQTMAVMAIAAALGPRLGVAAYLTYLGAGLAGLPVFAGSPERGIGLAYALGPTGGFLIGMLLMAGVTGWLAQGRGLVMRLMAMLAGVALVYAAGLAWLSGFVPADKLLAAGFTPFILGDLVKTVVAALLIEAGLRIRNARS